MKKEMKVFNDTWYRDCFYHGIAQIAYHFGCLEALFANDWFAYDYTSVDGVPTLLFEVNSFLPWKEVLQRNGVQTDTILVKGDFIPSICKELNAGRLAFVPINCFYEDIREDCYQKVHIAHWVVVYDYDTEQRKFAVLEHNYKNDLKLAPVALDFDVLERANKGYAELKQRECPSFLCFTKKDTSPVMATEKAFMWEALQRLKASVMNFEAFVHVCKQTLNHAFFCVQKLNYMVMFENVFKNIKHLKYCCEHVIKEGFPVSEEAYRGLCEHLSTREWSIFMGTMYKAYLTEEISDRTLMRLLRQLDTICEKERALRDYIQRMCE